jgi:hypothetical protein
MKPLVCLATAVVLLSLFACTSKPRGTGLYIFAPYADGKIPIDTNLGFASFLEMLPDGSYTSDLDRFDYGKWNFKDGRLYLSTQRRKTYVYTVLTLSKEELIVKLDSGREGHFHTHKMPSGGPENDPFSIVNNQWRMQAKHKESDADIRRRLLNHCRFWECFFTWVDDKDEGVVDVASFPTPMKIYGNGFGLKHYDNLPPVWKSYFFDEEDCHKADTMIKHTFRRNDIKWPETTDDYKKLISGFQQLQQFLR